MKIHTEVEQNSPDWLALRCGKVTASEACKLVTPTGKVATGDAVKTYLIQKLAERWSGKVTEVNGVFDIDQGSFLEEQARPAFTLHTNIETERIGFIESEDGAFGCSPDAVIYEDNDRQIVSGVEIKCPRLETHIRYLLDGKLPAQYVAQVQFSMHVTGTSSWHFFSYRRKLPPFHLVVERDSAYQAAISNALGAFLDAVDHAYEKLCRLNGGPPPGPKPQLQEAAA